MQGRVNALLAVMGIDTSPSSGQEDNHCPDACTSERHTWANVLQDVMQHLSPRVCTIQGTWVRLYNKEHDWVGSTCRWFDLCKCDSYNEVVVGLKRDGLGLRLLAIRSESGAHLFPC
jgi:hypothetical protein